MVVAFYRAPDRPLESVGSRRHWWQKTFGRYKSVRGGGHDTAA